MSDQLRAVNSKYNQIYDRTWELVLILVKQKILTEEAGNMILQKLKDLKSTLPTTQDFVADFLSSFKEERDDHAMRTEGKDKKILVRRSTKGEFIIRMYDQDYSDIKLVNS